MLRHTGASAVVVLCSAYSFQYIRSNLWNNLIKFNEQIELTS